MKFGGEYEVFVDSCNLPTPQTCQFRLDMPIEGSIDLDQIEESRKIFEWMDFLALYFGRIKHTVPIFVGPTGGTDANFALRFQG